MFARNEVSIQGLCWRQPLRYVPDSSSAWAVIGGSKNEQCLQKEVSYIGSIWGPLVLDPPYSILSSASSPAES